MGVAVAVVSIKIFVIGKITRNIAQFFCLAVNNRCTQIKNKGGCNAVRNFRGNCWWTPIFAGIWKKFVKAWWRKICFTFHLHYLVMYWLRSISNPSCLLTCCYWILVFRMERVSTFQGENGHSIVYLDQGRMVVSTWILKEYEKLLSETSFLRTHQSYLVNKNYIHRYHWKEGILTLKDGARIPVSIRKKGMINFHFKNL